MIHLSDISQTYPEPPSLSRMSDGSGLFPYLWRYFLSHQPVRDWLMRAPPYTAASMSPTNVSQGIAFCCNFTVPDLWTDMAACFDLGEMFIPDHPYSHFMCGSVVAATPFHKHLVCALGQAASRTSEHLPSYRTRVRRMVVDMGSSRSINIIEFSWMDDGALIVTTKILVPPNPNKQFQSAGCSGAFALFNNVIPGGQPPLIPRSLVSFVEAPRCPVCTQTGALGCYCSSPPITHYSVIPDDYSSSVWPPRIANDIPLNQIDTYHNIRVRLDLIQHVAHVKITAHLVTTNDMLNTGAAYKLGPSRFVVKAVLFRPSNMFEANTLRQVADKLRLLRSGILSLASHTNTSNSQSLLFKTHNLAHFPQPQVTAHSGDEETNNTAQIHSSATLTELPHSLLSTQITGAHVLPSESSQVSSAYKSAVSRAKITTATVSATKSGISRSASKITEITETPSTTTAQAVKKLYCQLCDKTFSQQGSLNRHLKNIHEEQKIPCQYCSMVFGQMFDLKRHQKRKHADKYCSNIKRERVDLRVRRAAAAQRSAD